MKRGATKEEIIRITQELITRNGIRAVRVDEIAQTLGISKRTLYEMFADKEDLVSACLDFMCHQQQERITAYRKRRSRSSLQRAFKLVYEYIEHLYTVESSFPTCATRWPTRNISTNTGNSGATNWPPTCAEAGKKSSCCPKSMPRVSQTGFWKRSSKCG